MHLVVLVSARGYEYVLEPSPVPLTLDRPQETRVLQVSCGRAHSLVLTDGEGGDVPLPGAWESGGHFPAVGPEAAHGVEPHLVSEAVGISRAS